MINDQQIASSISRILQRSERQEDYSKIIDSFVDTGIIEQVLNDNNQIIYGRRGTGKTHLLRYLEQKILERPNTICIYIDCRSLGSSTQFSDFNKPLGSRCLSLFKDIIQLINQNLLEELVNNILDSDKQTKGIDILDNLQKAILDPKTEYVPTELKVSSSLVASRGASLSVSTNSQSGILEAKNSKSTSANACYNVRSEDKVFFPEINSILYDYMILINRKLYIMIDEWSSLPSDIQPYLAEMLKKSIIPINLIVTKIASLEYRSSFYIHSSQSSIGLEVGSDITANIDVDDYYVFDKNPIDISNFFSQIIYKHLLIDLPENYLIKNYNVNNETEFILKLFSSYETFNELVRASEGVIRDLINIFTKAYFEAKKKKIEKIDKNVIINTAQQWYEQDKERNLTEELKLVLTRIIRDVIGEKKARSFLVSKQLENNQYLQQLFDLRILHIVKRGYADKSNPGERYNIYTLDYGTYVDLLKTKSKPMDEYIEIAIEDDIKDIIVPFDNNRTIRRIVLKEGILVI